MGMRMYSERLGVLDDTQFQAALERFGLGTFIQATPTHGGNFGQNVFVTSTTGAWVLRGVPHYDWQFPAEQFFCTLLHERTRVPVPYPYLFDPRDDIFGWSYVIMPRMPGLLLSGPEVDISLTPKDRLSMAHAMAENLVQQQELTWPYSGAFDVASGTIRPFPVDWAAWVAQDVRHWLERARAHSDRTTEADITWVEQVLYRAHDALTEPFVASFVMHDYTEMNVAFEHANSGWRVSGIFDLMEAFFGDGELDLARQTIRYISEAPELAHAFVRRYRALHPTRAGFPERFLVYMLWDRLVVWEFFQRPQRETPWEPALTLRMWLEPIVERFDPGPETSD